MQYSRPGVCVKLTAAAAAQLSSLQPSGLRLGATVRTVAHLSSSRRARVGNPGAMEGNLYREIEVNVFSAHDLRDVRLFGGKMSPYVVAWVHHDLKAYSPAAVKGNTEPSWHAKLLLYCDEAALQHPDEAIVYFELHDAASASDRLIGALSFPLADLPHQDPSDAVFLNLPVKRPSGREQGVLNISLKMGEVTQHPIAQEDPHHGLAPDDDAFLGGCCVLPHFSRDYNNFHRPAEVGSY